MSAAVVVCLNDNLAKVAIAVVFLAFLAWVCWLMYQSR